MPTYRIHPIVMGTKIFDKTMMTYQHGAGTAYTIPIYCWYLEGDAQICPDIEVIHTPAHTEGGLSVAIATEKGKAVITGFCTIDENFFPPKEVRAMEMDLIPPGTHVNTYDAYEIMARVKSMADILIPLHEPRFAAIDTV